MQTLSENRVDFQTMSTSRVCHWTLTNIVRLIENYHNLLLQLLGNDFRYLRIEQIMVTVDDDASVINGKSRQKIGTPVPFPTILFQVIQIVDARRQKRFSTFNIKTLIVLTNRCRTIGLMSFPNIASCQTIAFCINCFAFPFLANLRMNAHILSRTEHQAHHIRRFGTALFIVAHQMFQFGDDFFNFGHCPRTINQLSNDVRIFDHVGNHKR